jgi:hypothetical protein
VGEPASGRKISVVICATRKHLSGEKLKFDLSSRLKSAEKFNFSALTAEKLSGGGALLLEAERM